MYHARSRDSGAENMQAIERKTNIDPNVCEMKKVSWRQKTGSAFQVYGAMRSANVQSRCLSDMTIGKHCGVLAGNPVEFPRWRHGARSATSTGRTLDGRVA